MEQAWSIYIFRLLYYQYQIFALYQKITIYLRQQQLIQNSKIYNPKKLKNPVFHPSPMSSIQQINIILTIPTLPKDDFIIVHTSSPIKQFEYVKSIEDVTRDYRSLFEECRRVSQGQDSNGLVEKDDGIVNFSYLKRRRLNMGEKVRNKLESTNNKSDSMGKPVSTLQSRSSQGQQSLYTNLSKNQQLHPDNQNIAENLSSSFYSLRRFPHVQQSSKENQSFDRSISIQTHPFQCEEVNVQNPQKQKQKNNHLQFEQELSQIPIEESSLHSSPYNYFSAKTQSPSNSPFTDQRQSSPIHQLKDSNDPQIPANKIKLLNFNDESKIQKQLSSEQDQQVPNIKVSEPQPDEFTQNLKIVHSRVIDRPYFGNIENVESRCIACEDEPMPSWQNSFQYVMHQLNLLRSSVSDLQFSTNNLISLKNPSPKYDVSRSQIPSSIQKQQNIGKLDQSFILQLENNFNDIFQVSKQENDAQSLLIGNDSRTSREFEDEIVQKQRLYRTPQSFGNIESQMSGQEILSERINNVQKNRAIDPEKKLVTRVLSKTKQYFDLHQIVEKENNSVIF